MVRLLPFLQSVNVLFCRLVRLETHAFSLVFNHVIQFLLNHFLNTLFCLLFFALLFVVFFFFQLNLFVLIGLGHGFCGFFDFLRWFCVEDRREWGHLGMRVGRVIFLMLIWWWGFGFGMVLFELWEEEIWGQIWFGFERNMFLLFGE